MPNTTLNLSIPSTLKAKVQQQAQSRHFSSTSDYLKHLIRADIEKTEKQARLEAFVMKGLESGKGTKMTLDELDQWMSETIDNA